MNSWVGQAIEELRKRRSCERALNSSPDETEGERMETSSFFRRPLWVIAAPRDRQKSAKSRRWSLIRVQRGARLQVDRARLNHALPISDTNPVRLSAILSTDSSGAIPSKQTIGQGGEFPLRSKATSSPAPLLPNTNISGAICS